MLSEKPQFSMVLLLVAPAVFAAPVTIAHAIGAPRRVLVEASAESAGIAPGHVSVRTCTPEKYQYMPVSVAPYWPLLPKPTSFTYHGSTQKLVPAA